MVVVVVVVVVPWWWYRGGGTVVVVPWWRRYWWWFWPRDDEGTQCESVLQVSVVHVYLHLNLQKGLCGILYRLFIVYLWCVSVYPAVGTVPGYTPVPPKYTSVNFLHIHPKSICFSLRTLINSTFCRKVFERVDERQVKLLSTAVQHLPTVQPVPQHDQ